MADTLEELEAVDDTRNDTPVLVDTLADTLAVVEALVDTRRDEGALVNTG